MIPRRVRISSEESASCSTRRPCQAGKRQTPPRDGGHYTRDRNRSPMTFAPCVSQWLRLGALVVSSLVLSAGDAYSSGLDFEKEVWPILETHCMECHGEKQTYSNLRLDSPAAIRRGGELGEVLVPGDPESSEIYRRTALPADDLDFMPLDNEPLNAEELERLREWIAGGANFGAWSGP